ncbi:hypothetical protein KCP73_18070 [Salmonella enterica subsp. enterica]|nr:hypothetical protein KCP73_18070 [Salmonella enterica subsp. enterica]
MPFCRQFIDDVYRSAVYRAALPLPKPVFRPLSFCPYGFCRQRDCAQPVAS